MTHPTEDPSGDVTFNKFPNLLPSEGTPMSAKWSGPVFLKPKFSVTDFTTKDKDLYKMDPLSGFGPKGEYSQYYFQCVSNLMLSGRDFIDFVVWTSGVPTKFGYQHLKHKFWYKKDDEPVPNVHINRIFRDDLATQEAWRDLEEQCLVYTEHNSFYLLRNVQHLLGLLGYS